MMQGHIKEEDFSAYLDRQLDARQSQAVDEHLRSCEACSSLYDEMRDITRLFRESERAEPSPFLWSRIAASFEDGQARRGKASVFTGFRLFGWRPAMAAAALCFLLVLGGAVYLESTRNLAEKAALAEIDRTYRSLASKDPDTYNPFSTGSPLQFDSNPFRSLRLSGRAGTPPKN
jgi:predicted anti-sigma-YlaC factor YlaD